MRIVAGAFRGRRLAPLAGRGTRPSSDRLREAMFAALADVRDADVLDLFAGTGALGLEALSRGAASCCFCETAPAALATLRANVASLGVEARCTIVSRPAEWLLAGHRARDTRYDLVLVDPPYAILPDVTALLDASLHPIVPAGGRLVLESAAGSEPECAGFVVSSRRRIGAASLTILTREADPS